MNVLMGIMLAITAITTAVEFLENHLDDVYTTSAEKILSLKGLEKDLLDSTSELNQ
jgi:hypothetical protein